jgi:hypothetical protein
MLVANCVFNNNGGASGTYNLHVTNSGVLFAYNNTVRGCNSNFDSGIFCQSGTCHSRNNVIFNTNDPCYVNSGTLTNNNCVSDDATADDFSGAGNLASQTLPGSEFVDATNGNLHLAGTSTILLDAGGDLSSDPDTYGGSVGTYISVDIDGEARSGSWDIGADEIVSAGGRTTKNTRAFPLGIEIGMNWQGSL